MCITGLRRASWAETLCAGRIPVQAQNLPKKAYQLASPPRTKRRAAPRYQRSSLGPSSAPSPAGSSMPSKYHTAQNGTSISGQCRQ